MKNFKRFKTSNLFVLFALILTLSGIISAQEINGTIVGTVRDAAGAIVSGATVTIKDSNRNDTVVRTLTTNENGEFTAPNLPVSIYNITVEAGNFKKTLKNNIKLDVGARRPVDIVLEAGNISETVTVEADQVAVDLTTPTSSTVINGDQIRELSVNNRNFVQLVTLAPGVSSNLADQVYVGTTNPDGQANTVQISVNGARSSQNTFKVDGADVTDRGSNLTIQAYPSIDAIGEFKVLRSLYPAESGNSGGGQVTIVTRSGTDKFHGSLYEFVRNDALNSSSYFNNQTRPLGVDSDGKAIIPPFRYNNFGYTIGGPIYFLNFGEHNPNDSVFSTIKNTYFFFSQEFRRDKRYPTLNSTVPDQNLRNGIFPVDICLGGTITAGTGTCNPANILPAGTPLSSRTAINPVAQAYLTDIYNNIPLPNQPNYALSFPAINQSNFRQEILKFDTRFGEKLPFFYRFENDSIPTTDVNALFSGGASIPYVSTTETNSPGRTHTAQLTYVASPKVLIEGHYSYAYGAILSKNVGLIARQNATNVAGLLNFPQLAYPNTTDRVPNITGNGFNNIQTFGPYDNFSTKNSFGGNTTVVFGRHNIKFGGDYSKYRKNENALGGANYGAFSGFNNTTSASATQGSVLAPGVTNNALNRNLQLFANFLLGNNVTFSQAKYDLTADFRQTNFESYVQDEWKIKRNLTLYYGVRYSFFGSPWDKNGFLTNFDPDLYNRANAPTVNGAGNRVAGTGNFCEGLIYNAQNPPTSLPTDCRPTASPYGKFIVDAKKNNFAPRVGLAFDPFGNGTTSIRTGYGIYHEQTLVGIFEQNLGTNPPYQETFTITRTTLNQPVPVGTTVSSASSLTTQTIRAEQTDWKTPYTQQWSLDVQHQLDKDTLIDIGYYGSKGTHLIGIVDINLLKPGFAATQNCAVGSAIIPTVPCQAPGVPFTTSAASVILDQIRPYRGYRAINMIQPRFNSNYHSLQFSGQRRFSGASQINVAYTFSKNLTDAQTDRSSAPQNPYDIKSEYGRAALDRRHILTTNFIYELPFFRERNDWVETIFGGIQTSGIFTYQTGLPYTATVSGFDPAGIGFLGPSAAGGRPDQIGDPNSGAPHTQGQFFNTGAFQTVFPTSGVNIAPGSAGRGTINGPRTIRFDFSLMKNFRFSESMNLQLRGEAFNVFNTTNFTTFGTTASATTFGVVSGARDPRTIQLGIKFLF